jgi:hypothetical protein
MKTQSLAKTAQDHELPRTTIIAHGVTSVNSQSIHRTDEISTKPRAMRTGSYRSGFPLIVPMTGLVSGAWVNFFAREGGHQEYRVSMKKRSLLPGAFVFVLTLAAAHAEPSFVDEAGKHLTVLNADGAPVLRYEYAHEVGEDGKVSFDTAKVFHHVLGPGGKPITKGPGGKFPHHRGIFIGWNKIRHGGRSHDLWHVRDTTQKHVSFTEKKSADESATMTSRIDWIGKEGHPVLEESRTLTVHFADEGAYALIDFTSELTAAHGAVELGGDPEHAGIHFRPSQEVAGNKSARYTFHEEGVTPKKNTGLPWVAQTFEADGRTWIVQHMSHPQNPDGSRWSAYRDYGRFGEFPAIKLADGESITLRYRFRVTEGPAPERSLLGAAYESFAK